MAIQKYFIEIEYHFGRRMQHVNALSRNPLDDYVDLNVVTLEDGNWFLTVQLQVDD